MFPERRLLRGQLPLPQLQEHPSKGWSSTGKGANAAANHDSIIVVDVDVVFVVTIATLPGGRDEGCFTTRLARRRGSAERHGHEKEEKTARKGGHNSQKGPRPPGDNGSGGHDGALGGKTFCSDSYCQKREQLCCQTQEGTGDFARQYVGREWMRRNHPRRREPKNPFQTTARGIDWGRISSPQARIFSARTTTKRATTTNAVSECLHAASAAAAANVSTASSSSSLWCAPSTLRALPISSPASTPPVSTPLSSVTPPVL
mmetsp:Transcript_9373/g.23342  ORF Transcript_9373/g.23342 Transcript_9373/m.23342 type:complete len:260 (-) Transcript_9373:478-1257(-)